MTAIEALKQIKKELAGSSVDVVPPDWKTAKQWARESNQSDVNVSRLLNGGVAIGAVEKKTFRVITGERPRPVIHFRYIDKGKKK